MQVKALSLALPPFSNNPESQRQRQRLCLHLRPLSHHNRCSKLSLTSQTHSQEEQSSISDTLTAHTIWAQMKHIAMFSGPATALWISAPFMSLISTALVGRRSSTHLAALGPGTVFCDNMNLLFMFLSIATSNLVATSLAKGDKKQVQHQISMLLFVAFICGSLMLLFTQFLGSWALTSFTGPKNVHIVPAATKYVQIRGLAWPAVLYGLVAQSARFVGTSEGFGHCQHCEWLWSCNPMQFSAVWYRGCSMGNNGIPDCSSFYDDRSTEQERIQCFWFFISIVLRLPADICDCCTCVCDDVLKANGTHTVAAHQVMIQMYSICVVWGEPLSQTAQSFMPELLYGFNRSLKKARILLKSLVIIGALLGLVIGLVGMSVPWLFPNIFTPDLKVIREMHNVLIMFFIALSVSPCTHSLEGTLLAGRDLNFISLSMSGCFSLGALLLLIVSSRGYGLPGCWCALVGFQWARFFLALRRLFSPNGVLYSEEDQFELEKMEAAKL
ncbi:protein DETOXIFICATION 46, chloroplastic isoform X6 [Cajanus cajan]|uniref:protein DETOXIFICATION 46, chloroplastic isoform X6 n=1 Tax=Cajanus cajan TaxID=3821 RepID=UPI0010FB707A|nr:protein DETOXIFICATION 46, chloroplastic isoform X6 [Cajanus cajan]